MNVEQRLIQAFESSARIEPTPDLFSRVVHSIDEDRRHRRRVARTVAATAVSFVAVVFVGVLSLQESRAGRFVHRPTMELLEAVALVTLLLALGPAIGRFGRNYAADLWPRGATTPRALLRLLDVAFYLIGAGYVLLSTEFQFGVFDGLLAEQLGDASIRIGGLVLALGVLHASTLFVLPLIAFVDNATRTGRKLPRWVLLVLILVGWLAVNWVPFALAMGLSD